MEFPKAENPTQMNPSKSESENRDDKRRAIIAERRLEIDKIVDAEGKGKMRK